MPQGHPDVAHEEDAGVGHDGHRAQATERFQHALHRPAEQATVEQVRQGEQNAQAQFAGEHHGSEGEHGRSRDEEDEQGPVGHLQIPPQADHGDGEDGGAGGVDCRFQGAKSCAQPIGPVGRSAMEGERPGSHHKKAAAGGSAQEQVRYDQRAVQSPSFHVAGEGRDWLGCGRSRGVPVAPPPCCVSLLNY